MVSMKTLKTLCLIVALLAISASASPARRTLQQFSEAPANANGTEPAAEEPAAPAETAGDEVDGAAAAPEPTPETTPEANATAAEPEPEAPAAAAAPAAFNQGVDECIYGDHPATIVETAGSAPDFSTLVAALNASGLITAFDDISSKVTVFAPTNAAFAKLFADFNVTAEQVLGNTKFLTDVLKYHVAADVLPFDSFSSGEEIPTLQGESLGVSTEAIQATVYSFGFPVGVTSSEAVTLLGGATNATIVQGNLWTCNGVIQVIDTVLVPQSAVTSDQ